MSSSSPWTWARSPQRSPEGNIAASKISRFVKHPDVLRADAHPTFIPRTIFVSSLQTQGSSTLPEVSTTQRPKESRPGVWTASLRPPLQSLSTKLIGTSRSTVMINTRMSSMGRRARLNRKPRTVGPNQFYQTLSLNPCLVGGRLVRPPP